MAAVEARFACHVIPPWKENVVAFDPRRANHHAKQYPDRVTAEKRESYLKSGWGRKELAVLLERWQSG